MCFVICITTFQTFVYKSYCFLYKYYNDAMLLRKIYRRVLEERRWRNCAMKNTVLTADECRYNASEMGRTYRGEASSTSYPAGSFFIVGYSNVYFNPIIVPALTSQINSAGAICTDGIIILVEYL